MCIYTGKISQGFMDLLGVSDSKAFADNFYDALGKMKAEGFKQPVQLVVAKELGGTKWWRRTRLSFIQNAGYEQKACQSNPSKPYTDIPIMFNPLNI